MDPLKYTTIGHAGMRVLGPVGERTLDALMARMLLAPGEPVLDIGCGKAELLLRLVERYGVRAVGVDRNPAFIAEAREAAAERVPEAKVTLLELDAARFVAPAHSFAAALCIGATQAFGGYQKALLRLAHWVRPGGYLVLGEGFWQKPPAQAYLDFLGGPRAMYNTHAGNIATAEASGCELLWAAASSQAEWDAYEAAYGHNLRAYAAGHPEDPDSAAIGERSERWTAAYEQWGRGTLGFGLYLLRVSRV